MNEQQVCVEGGCRGGGARSSSALVGEAKPKQHTTPDPETHDTFFMNG